VWCARAVRRGIVTNSVRVRANDEEEAYAEQTEYERRIAERACEYLYARARVTWAAVAARADVVARTPDRVAGPPFYNGRHATRRRRRRRRRRVDRRHVFVRANAHTHTHTHAARRGFFPYISRKRVSQ